MRNNIAKSHEYDDMYDIISNIPDYFYFALGGEYVSIFGASSLIQDADGFTLLDYDCGTMGYMKAFLMTCAKLDMRWLFKYWESLSLQQRDIFDEIIQNKVSEKFNETPHQTSNSYFKYLMNTEQLPDDVVSRRALEDIKWERDIAINQLKEIGKSFGERMDDIVELLQRKADN